MKVLLVDDHALFREGLKILLSNIDDFNEVVEQETGKGAIEYIAEQGDEIDVVLLDYQLDDMTGLEVLQAVKKDSPELPVIMLSAHEDPSLIQDMLGAGASGFITKSSSSGIMLSAISLVVSGGIYVPPEMLAKSTAKVSSSVQSFLSPKPIECGFHITNRQLEVLQEMGLGLSNKEIARELGMSPSTVKVHVAAILREMDVKNRTQAVSMANEKGLLDLR